jgi:hypothetical protein
MSTQHTPGQWVVGSKSEYGTYNANMIFDSQGGSVAMVYGLPSNTMLEKMNGEQYADGKARANLIAAAPDLMEALQDLFDADMEHVLMGDGKDDQIEAIAKARAAIAKATGAA